MQLSKKDNFCLNYIGWTGVSHGILQFTSIRHANCDKTLFKVQHCQSRSMLKLELIYKNLMSFRRKSENFSEVKLNEQYVEIQHPFLRLRKRTLSGQCQQCVIFNIYDVILTLKTCLFHGHFSIIKCCFLGFISNRLYGTAYIALGYKA